MSLPQMTRPIDPPIPARNTYLRCHLRPVSRAPPPPPARRPAVLLATTQPVPTFWPPPSSPMTPARLQSNRRCPPARPAGRSTTGAPKTGSLPCSAPTRPACVVPDGICNLCCSWISGGARPPARRGAAAVHISRAAGARPPARRGAAALHGSPEAHVLRRGDDPRLNLLK